MSLEIRLKAAREEFPNAKVIYDKDGYWDLECSKCGRSQFWPIDSIEDDLMVLEDQCFYGKIAKKFPDKNVLVCDGETDYILVKKEVETNESKNSE